MEKDKEKQSAPSDIRFTWPQPPRPVAFPIAAPGYPLIIAGAFITLILAILQLHFFTLMALAATIFVCAFFRDPERATPDVPGAVVSPADGRVILAALVEDNPHMPGPAFKISIFMNVFNVHVNRAPYDGRVTRVAYQPGRFLSANRDKASLENEHNAVTIQTPGGQSVCFVQIAGLVARRIICGVAGGERLSRGQRFGMICFGSRLDVYLPPDARCAVTPGQRVSAGASIIAHLTE